MVVCAHGDVIDFCEKHEMQILTAYDGELKDYRGDCAVVVTAQEMSRAEYDSLKCTLFSRGVELVSTAWTDDEVIVRLLLNQIEQRGKRGGRQMFGFTKRNGQIVEIPDKMAVARRVIKLREEGKTLREIKERVDLSISTIQTILNNWEAYQK